MYYDTITTFQYEENNRTKIKELIASNPNHIELLINGVAIKNNDSIIHDIASVRKLSYHHSTHINDKKVKLISNEKELVFFVGQDSDINDEFWVLIDTSDLGDIGKFKSKSLSEVFNTFN